ncbi:DUF1513 domain-containing protein [Vibrio parahaemolyticus]|uniref:DUF1513 domain-containing protein n=1 Tax=Vibrio parahaemolyticus TaxID=670 RepID=UPI00084A395C|nr:DUF1513 domain-containing protein [Vibrio parahaemolyticus]EHR0574331.1 DUF1513 domain-containing protein [Vibrio parahaemolyticus]EJG1712591.1 DUF1513 domain-containing protein [Vibrio parahaemolyticus]EME0113884.1 DUF1513 domain-containing protein [Vibrio parahaemolyticus]MBO0166166.1 DUF1513 domain-containing protein [Vibrio parahaemolyticus]MCR9655836.1 DUF1513 domain-containing protein [Vibrio parahaemolyticus]
MQPMVTDQTRRTLLKAALLGAATPVLPFGCAATTKREPALIGCSIVGRDKFAAVVADEHGMPISTLPIPERGHGVATNQHGHAVVFGRRPGAFFMVFDYRTEQMLKLELAKPDRHFYGHGVYSHDGLYLFATEGERGTSRGIIGVYDVQNQYRKIAELSGFGIGPHEVIMMPDGTLAIGVGGVHTNGREPLNLDSMTPSLSYLSQNGELLDQVALPDHKLSIRHLAHDGSETVLCGQQYRGEPDEYPALLAMHTRGGEMQILQAEPEEWARFNHYIASIAATNDWILATSPPGSCYGIWSKDTGKLVELNALPDASGVVIYGDEFRVSSGAGKVVEQSPSQFKNAYASGVQWDNHWSRII